MILLPLFGKTSYSRSLSGDNSSYLMSVADEEPLLGAKADVVAEVEPRLITYM